MLDEQTHQLWLASAAAGSPPDISLVAKMQYSVFCPWHIEETFFDLARSFLKDRSKVHFECLEMSRGVGKTYGFQIMFLYLAEYVLPFASDSYGSPLRPEQKVIILVGRNEDDLRDRVMKELKDFIIFNSPWLRTDEWRDFVNPSDPDPHGIKAIASLQSKPAQKWEAYRIDLANGVTFIGRSIRQGVRGAHGLLIGVDDLLEEKNAHESAEMYELLMSSHGKALALDTPIPTPTGWTTMGDIKAGDMALDENGNPCRVIRATEVQYNRPCYRVHFNDGTSIVADAEHPWQTRTWKERNRMTMKRGVVQRSPAASKTRTTLEIQKTLRFQPAKMNNAYNHTIDVAGAWNLPERNLPIDPYVLGVWLGDGTSIEATVWSDDEEIIDEVRKAGYPVRRGKKPYQWIVNDGAKRTGKRREGTLYTQLKDNNLFGNKHIPEDYLLASKEQRLALLQGLMDTDGTVSLAAHRISFTSTLPHLAKQVFGLVASLGMVPHMNSYIPKITGRPEAVCERAYRINFSTKTPVFRLRRKVEKQAEAVSNSRISTGTRRFIISIEPVESVPVRCIAIDTPTHLYLAGESGIPTHNTLEAGGLLMVDGTPQFPGDMYDLIKDSGRFRHRQFPAYDEDATLKYAEKNKKLLGPTHFVHLSKVDRHCLWPTRMSWEFLEQDRGTSLADNERFQRERMLKRITVDSALVHPDYIEAAKDATLSYHDVAQKGHHYYLGHDPSSLKRDNAAWCIGYFDADKCLVPAHFKVLVADPRLPDGQGEKAVVEELNLVCKQFNYPDGVVESNGFQGILKVVGRMLDPSMTSHLEKFQLGRNKHTEAGWLGIRTVFRMKKVKLPYKTQRDQAVTNAFLHELRGILYRGGEIIEDRSRGNDRVSAFFLMLKATELHEAIVSGSVLSIGGESTPGRPTLPGYQSFPKPFSKPLLGGEHSRMAARDSKPAPGSLSEVRMRMAKWQRPTR